MLFNSEMVGDTCTISLQYRSIQKNLHIVMKFIIFHNVVINIYLSHILDFNDLGEK